ncbi:patatin-like phospholipase family protein [Treponema sp. R6D11]
MQNDIGLVFCGGGGKGAYQIGVWQALREYNFDEFIGATSGTSVGALNAALFCAKDLNKALKVWQSINPQEVLALDYNIDLADGVFANIALGKLVKSSIDAEKISKSKIEFYATATKLGNIATKLRTTNTSNKLVEGLASVAFIKSLKADAKCEYFHVNNVPLDKIPKILLASAAIPIVFPAVEIDGCEYVDGGVKDNMPIKPLYDIGYKKFIVICLEEVGFLPFLPYRDAKAVYLNLGEKSKKACLIDTLNFTSKTAHEFIQKGYKDTVAKMHEIFSLVK